VNSKIKGLKLLLKVPTALKHATKVYIVSVGAFKISDDIPDATLNKRLLFSGGLVAVLNSPTFQNLALHWYLRTCQWSYQIADDRRATGLCPPALHEARNCAATALFKTTIHFLSTDFSRNAQNYLSHSQTTTNSPYIPAKH
jgi:hypothetical protein